MRKFVLLFSVLEYLVTNLTLRAFGAPQICWVMKDTYVEPSVEWRIASVRRGWIIASSVVAPLPWIFVLGCVDRNPDNNLARVHLLLSKSADDAQTNSRPCVMHTVLNSFLHQLRKRKHAPINEGSMRREYTSPHLSVKHSDCKYWLHRTLISTHPYAFLLKPKRRIPLFYCVFR